MARVPFLLLVWFGALISAFAQDSLDKKIRLMSEALRARDAGDVPAAQRALADLITLAPNDPAAQRLRIDIERQAAAQQAALLSQTAEAERAAREAEATLAAQRAASQLNAAAANSGVPRMIDVHIPEPGQPTPPASSTRSEAAETLARVESARVNALVVSVEAQLTLAKTWLRQDKADDALELLDSALGMLPVSTVTQRLIGNLNREKANVQLTRARQLLRRDDLEGARAALAAHVTLAPGSTRAAGVERQIARAERKRKSAPPEGTASVATPTSVATTLLPPSVSTLRPASVPVAQKLDDIVLPAIDFTAVDLTRVVATLSAAAAEFDPAANGRKGINLVLLDPASRAPTITLALRNITFRRALDLITESIGYHYEVQSDAVLIRPGAALVTRLFPLSRSGLRRLTALGGSAHPANGEIDTTAVRAFLQQVGIAFGEGAAVAYDGSALIVTQTPANLERIDGLLAHYKEVRQVAVEARFLAAPAGTFGTLGMAAPATGFTSLLGGTAVATTLNGLLDRPGVELLGSPRITALSGSPASMTIGQAPAASRQLAAELRVTPTVRDDDRSVTLELRPKITTPDGFTEASTQVVLEDGATLLLSGLLAQNRELLIGITVRIVKPEGTDGF